MYKNDIYMCVCVNTKALSCVCKMGIACVHEHIHVVMTTYKTMEISMKHVSLSHVQLMNC